MNKTPKARNSAFALARSAGALRTTVAADRRRRHGRKAKHKGR